MRKVKRTKESFQKELDIINPEYKIIEDYINNNKKILFSHSCGFEFLATPRTILAREIKCPVCFPSRVQTTESFKERVKRMKNGNNYEVLGEYKNNKEKILIKCKQCKKEFKVVPQKFLSGVYKCSCQIPEIKKATEKKVKSVTEEKIKGFSHPFNPLTSGTHIYDLDGKNKNLVNTQNRIEDVKDIRKTFSKERPMPRYKSEGITFSDFIEELKKHFSDFEENRKINETILQYYFPEKKVAFNFYTMIEASETLGGKKKGWMVNDYKESQEKGIQLIQILEEEWELRKEVLKSKLLHQLDLIETKPIYTRKCFVREILTEEKDDFCKKFHIQAGDLSAVRLGLFFENELVAVQTYSKPRLCMGIKSDKVEEREYELIRFCCNTSYKIQGAFGKLQKYFIKNYNPKRIKTFADLRWTNQNNNIYRKNGYKYSHTTESNYWYFNYSNADITKKHRFNFRKQEVLKRFSPNCSELLGEYENCLRNGFDRIWDAGNDLYILEI